MSKKQKGRDLGGPSIVYKYNYINEKNRAATKIQAAQRSRGRAKPWQRLSNSQPTAASPPTLGTSPSTGREDRMSQNSRRTYIPVKKTTKRKRTTPRVTQRKVHYSKSGARYFVRVSKVTGRRYKQYI